MQASAAPASTDPNPSARVLRAPRRVAGAVRDWWQVAQRLEAEGRLDDAERVIRRCCPSPDYARALAELYELRMHRLGALGDRSGERDAFLETVRWIDCYAALAGSTR